MRTDPSLAGLVLAAGGSRRFGRAKQLEDWRGMPMICWSVAACLEVCGAGVTVVTGAAAAQVDASLADYPVRIVHNPDWQAGMSGSLRAGLVGAAKPDVAALLITVSDQPLVTAADLAVLVAGWHSNPARMAASRYSGAIGVPAIFPVAILPQLRALQGDNGARKLLRSEPDISIVDMPSAGIDIDTPDDLQALRDSAGEQGPEVQRDPK